jgi:signal transduction histidine kinase
VALLTPSRPLRRILLVLVAVTQVPTLITMGALSYVQYQREREAVTDQLVERSRRMAVALRERIEAVQGRLEDLAPQVPDDPSRMGEFQETARAQLRPLGVDAISLAAPSGQLVMNTRISPGSTLPVAAPAVMEIFRQAKRTTIDLTTGAVTGKLVAGVGVPVVRESRIHYALNAGMEPERFRQLIEDQNLPAGWLAAIVDAQGRIVARTPAHERFVGRHVSGTLADRLEAAGGGSGPLIGVFEGETLDGIDVVTSMRRSPVTGWTIVVSVPRSVLVAPVWRSAGWLAVFLVLVFGVTISLALFISGRIVSCIAKLRDAAANLPAMQAIDFGGLCFAEAQQLGHTLEDARRRIAQGQAELETVTHNFNRSLIREVEKRQQQVARELHDSVGSSLAGVSLILGSASAAAKDNARLSTLLLKAHEQVSDTAQHVREISRGMTPAGSEAGALLPAIEQFAAHLTQYNHVHCTVHSRGDFSQVPAETGTHIYRIVQEATNNAMRHGAATAIRIMLAESGGRCRLTISDNGLGCNFDTLSNSHAGVGLRSMQARARAMDGVFEIGNRPGGGCRLRVEWTHVG